MKADIDSMAQLLAFRKDVRDFLEILGLADIPREEILLAATELGTNLFRHGGGGTLELLSSGPGPEVLTLISSNPFDSPLGAGVLPFPLQSSGLGLGLESLERLMDRVEISQRKGIFKVVAEKDIPRSRLNTHQVR